MKKTIWNILYNICISLFTVILQSQSTCMYALLLRSIVSSFSVSIILHNFQLDSVLKVPTMTPICCIVTSIPLTISKKSEILCCQAEGIKDNLPQGSKIQLILSQTGVTLTHYMDSIWLKSCISLYKQLYFLYSLKKEKHEPSIFFNQINWLEHPEGWAKQKSDSIWWHIFWLLKTSHLVKVNN